MASQVPARSPKEPADAGLYGAATNPGPGINATGGYAFLGVAPGTHDILAEQDTLSDRQEDVSVAANNVVVVDLALK